MKRVPILALLLGAIASPAMGNDEEDWILLGYDRHHTASLNVPPDADPAAVELLEHIEIDLLESFGTMVQSQQDIVANCRAGTLQRGKHRWILGHGFSNAEKLPFPDPMRVVVDPAPRVPEKDSRDEGILEVACAKRGEGAQAGMPRFVGPYLNQQLIEFLKKSEPGRPLPTVQGIMTAQNFVATVSGETYPNRTVRALREKCEASGVQCTHVFMSRRCVTFAGATGGLIPGFGDTAKAASDDAMASCKAAGGSDCTLRSEPVCP